MERFRIVESTDRWSSRKFVPSGELCIRIGSYSQKKIRDGRRPLEELIPRIMAKLELDAKQTMEDRRIQAEKNRIQEEKLRKFREEQEIIEKEISDFKELINNANLWHYSRIIRGYIWEVKRTAISNQSLTPEVENWIKWAKMKAEWLDPTSQKTDLLLDDLILDHNPFEMKREKKPFSIWS